MRAALVVVAVLGVLGLVLLAANGSEPMMLLLPGALGAFVLLLALQAVLRRERVQRGEALMNEGRFSEASAILERDANAFQLNAHAMYALGVCRLNLWQLGRAWEALDKARLQQPLSDRGDQALEDRIQHHLAMTLVLYGEWQNGRDWMLLVPPLRQRAGLAPLVFAAVAARQANWPEVRKHLSSCKREVLSAPLRELARVFDAWSTEQLGEPRPPINRVALYAEAGPEELKKRWPELADFVERAA